MFDKRNVPNVKSFMMGCKNKVPYSSWGANCNCCRDGLLCSGAATVQYVELSYGLIY